jgi:plastocyanin
MARLLHSARCFLRLGVVLLATAAALLAPLAPVAQAQPWPFGMGPWPPPWDLSPPVPPPPALLWGGPPVLGVPAPPPRPVPQPPPRPEEQRGVVVTMQDFSFLPEEITVPVGTRVIWRNRGGTAHTTTATGIWDSGVVRPGQSWAAIFAVPGTFDYLCTIHPDRMRGRIIVEGATSTTTGPAGAAAAPGSPAAPAASVSPRVLLQRLAEAFNRGDAAGVLALLTEDVNYQGAGTCPQGCVGRDAAQREIARAISARFNLQVGPAQEQGNTASGSFQATSDELRTLGVQALTGTVSVETRGDRIAAVRVVLDPNDPQNHVFVQRMTTLLQPTAAAPSGTAQRTSTAGAATYRATLSPQAGSGVTGEATLSQADGATTVTVTLSGLAPGSAHAGHIHSGACSGPILYPLATIRADSTGQGGATSTVNAPVDPATWWVQYHASESPPGPPIACGQPTPAP